MGSVNQRANPKQTRRLEPFSELALALVVGLLAVMALSLLIAGRPQALQPGTVATLAGHATAHDGDDLAFGDVRGAAVGDFSARGSARAGGTRRA